MIQPAPATPALYNAIRQTLVDSGPSSAPAYSSEEREMETIRWGSDGTEHYIIYEEEQ